MIGATLLTAFVTLFGLGGLGVGLRLVALGTVNPKTLERVARALGRDPARLKGPLAVGGLVLSVGAALVLAWGYRLARALLDRALYGP